MKSKIVFVGVVVALCTWIVFSITKAETAFQASLTDADRVYIMEMRERLLNMEPRSFVVSKAGTIHLVIDHDGRFRLQDYHLEAPGPVVNFLFDHIVFGVKEVVLPDLDDPHYRRLAIQFLTQESE